MSRRNKRLAATGMQARFYVKSCSASRWAFALPLCLALAACDSQPDVRLQIHSPQPLAQDCLEKLPTYLAPQVSLAAVHRPRPEKAVEYEVRGQGSRIALVQDFDTNIIDVALTSEGSPEQKRESLGLLKDVHSGVLRACELDSTKVRVDRSCSGDACKDPAYPGL